MASELRRRSTSRLELPPVKRWRAFLTVDAETAIYCPDCAREEFDNG